MEPTETRVWFYIKDRQQYGPVGFFELTKLFEQGVLNGETYLWTTGAECWKTARCIEKLKKYRMKNPPPESSPSKTINRPKNKPFLRFIAELFDISLFTVLLSTFISIFSLDLILKTSKLTLFLIYLLLWTLLEPIMLSIFGTTIGKSLFKIKIKCVNGQLLDLLTAFKRDLFILTFGKGIRFPIINLILNIRKKARLIWDVKAGTIVLYGHVGLPRILLGTCFPITVFITGIIIS
jgi:uncharacterized RDD family membrane protein YckC